MAVFPTFLIRVEVVAKELVKLYNSSRDDLRAHMSSRGFVAALLVSDSNHRSSGHNPHAPMIGAREPLQGALIMPGRADKPATFAPGKLP